MRKIKILFSLAILLALGVPASVYAAKIKNGEQLVGAMHKKYAVTCTRKITPIGRRESTKIKIGDSSNEKDFYG